MSAARAGSARASRIPVAKGLGRRLGEDRDLVGEHLRVSEQPRGHDDPARPQVLVDLERRVRAAASWRHQHVGGVEEVRDLVGGPLAGKGHDGAKPAGGHLACRSGDLVGAPSRQQETRVRSCRVHGPRGVKEKVQSLIRLEGPRVEHQRGRRPDSEFRAYRLAPAVAAHFTGAGGVFDQHRGRLRRDLANLPLQLRADHDDDARTPNGLPLEDLERPAQHARSAELEVHQLLRQARMHVVEMRHPEHRRQDQPDGGALFVRMHRVVARAGDATQRRDRQRHVERHLGERRPDADIRDERRSQAAKDAQARHRHVVAERVGHQIDRVPEFDERADAVVFAERGAPGLEKRLRRDHEDVQAQTSSLESHRGGVNVAAGRTWTALQGP